LPAARPLLRAARVVPGRGPRVDDGLRREPRQGGREPEGGAPALHLQCPARLREGLREDPDWRRCGLDREAKDLPLGRGRGPRREPPPAARPARAGGARVEAQARPQARLLEAPDRKSTRLNSHEWISYAVFCLKK